MWISFTELSPAASAELLRKFPVLKEAVEKDNSQRLTLTDEELTTSLSLLGKSRTPGTFVLGIVILSGITEPRVIQSIMTTGTLNEYDNKRIFTISSLSAAVMSGALHVRALHWMHSHISPECESVGEIGEFSLPRTISLGEVFSKLSDSNIKEELCFNDFQLSQTTLEQIFNRFAHGDHSV